ncbi:ZIP family metal transporter [bacterium]|nr:ZIP family metal transporter [bacterium]
MQPLIFSLLAACASVMGGAIPLLNRRLREEHLTLLMAFSAGVLLSTGLNHMVIESYAQAGRWAMLAVSAGFLLLYCYEKLAMVHACRERDCEVHELGNAALLGLGLHSFLDGFAIAVSFEFAQPLGVLVIGAVILHRFPTGICTATILLSNDYEKSKAWLTLNIIAGLAVLGALVGVVVPISEKFVLSLAVGLSGGTFLYISTSDLLPMAHENSHDYRVPFSFLLGFIGVLGTSFFNGG